MFFQTFDSFDEMQAALDAAREAADQSAEHWQLQSKPGQCALLWSDELEQYMFVELLDPVATAADPAEREYMSQVYSAPEMVCCRWARTFSCMCPEGELGDVHVSQLACLLPRFLFELARGADWFGFEQDAVEVALTAYSDDILHETQGNPIKA